ncbi:MAG: hypothetical protein NTX25_21675, partial [Proteobacteria bacterium]|nr:hypothetical protein [Pseudomonadota bacterium]
MLTHKARFILVTFIVLTLTTCFGYFSRYPDLNRKAMVAENHSVGDTISMWPIFKISANDPTWKKIA